jgi:hypothetical protein
MSSEPKTVTVPQPPAAESGLTTRTEFGAIVHDRKAETAANALAAQAAAAVQARFVMALQRPRDIDLARVKILGACKRPLFAKGALYKKPVGRKYNEDTGKWEEQFVTGLSIRFAEEAIRALGNAMTESLIVYDDPRRRIIRISVTDMETNTVHFKDINVEKTVERSKLKKGQTAISQRVNSYGDAVYIVEATDDDLLVKAGALTSKALRDKILMLLPSDIQEEAKQEIVEIQAKKDAADPQGARKAMIDSFAEVGVLPNHLTEYVGHDLGALTPQELQHLRAIYSAIKEGEATWADVAEHRRDFEAEKAKRDASKTTTGGTPPAAKSKPTVNDVAKDAKAKREAAAKPEDNISKPVPAAREPGDDGDEDAANRAAAAPTADEMAKGR